MPLGPTAALVVLAAVAGCGGATKTVTVTHNQGAGTTSTATSPTTPSAPARGGPRCQDAACAVRIVAGRGYTANPQTFNPSRNLNVLLGLRTGSADGTLQNAFFFWQGRYIGTDTSDNSAGIRFASASDDTIALVYRLYNPQDPQCCATAGQTTVRFHWQGSRLVPLDPIPSSSPTVRSSRR